MASDLNPKKPRVPLIVYLAFAAFVISQANLAWMVAPLKPNLFALQLAFTPERFWSVLQAWGAEGIVRFRAHFLFDMIHPCIYGFFGYVAASSGRLFDGMSAGWRRVFIWMLPSAAVMDYVENLSHLHLLDMAPGTPAALIILASVCSALKWGLAVWFTCALARQLLKK